jgi:hypothetical protein
VPIDYRRPREVRRSSAMSLDTEISSTDVLEQKLSIALVGQRTQRYWHLLRWHFAALLVVLVFFGAIRWRLLDMPLERDEGEYASAGQLILEGVPPYKVAYNMKLSGTYLAYAGMLAVFGETARGIHLGLLFVNAGCVILLWAVTARLFGPLAGTVAGASYSLLSASPAVLGFEAHATHFIVLTALSGLILLLRAVETGHTTFFFGRGLAFGLTFLMKQPGILLGTFAFLYLALQCWPKDKLEWAPWAKNMGAFLLAGTLPFAVTCCVLYRAGVFQNFWFWTFTYARQYATMMPLGAGLGEFAYQFYKVVHFAPWLWTVALIGVSTGYCDPVVRRRSAFVFGLLVFSFAAVCPGLYFRPHYFIVMIPAVAILIAAAVTSTIRLVATKSTSHWPRALPVIVFVTVWVLAIHRNREFYFEMIPVQASRFSYAAWPGLVDPFLGAAQVAEYLREHTVPTDTIMVCGSEPEIYFYAHRRSASGYIYTYSLVEPQTYWPAMQREMTQEVERSRPAYVVFVNNWYSWNGNWRLPQATALRAWMNQYISSSFEETGKGELEMPDSRYLQHDAIPGHPKSDFDIVIFKRKG